MWLGRFEEPLPLRCRGRFHLYTARDRGAPVVVVVPADPLPGAACEASLDRLAAAHSRIRSPRVASVHEAGRFEDRPFVAFACDAVLDGEALIGRLGERAIRVPYAEAMTAVDHLTSALDAAHRLAPPSTLGAIAWGNVLVTAAGELQVIGFGHNVIACDEHGGAIGAPSVFMAPELAAGAGATPAGDVHAFVALQRSLVAYTTAPPELRQAFGGLDDRSPLGEISRWVDAKILSAPPAQRASIGELGIRIAREMELLGLRFAVDELRARLASLVAEEAPRADVVGSPGAVLTVARDAAWLVAPSGERYTVVGRALRRLLLALVRARRDQPGLGVAADQLVAAGWPGESPIREAGLNRVYVAVSQLRKRGLRDLLQREAEGYRLDPSIQIVIA